MTQTYYCVKIHPNYPASNLPLLSRLSLSKIDCLSAWSTAATTFQESLCALWTTERCEFYSKKLVLPKLLWLIHEPRISKTLSQRQSYTSHLARKLASITGGSRPLFSGKLPPIAPFAPYTAFGLLLAQREQFYSPTTLTLLF